MSRVAEPLLKTRQERMKEINSRNKEKERMKEREKEAREREARWSNGHLFTSLTVSATTLCSSCNRSITAKEALSCPTYLSIYLTACNVTIHNRCRDTLASCVKMKQKQQKLALVRNSSALQNVTLRNKTPMMKERPSSAIYPSDSLRQSLLGSRRVRSGLSLAKSVSTNNIAGCEDSPVGLRRILSQSSDSLNFRNRTMSLESLTDEGDMYYSLLEDLQEEGKCVCADSWSVAVDHSFLQSQRKDVIKRQDVIYELIQTEFHHVRTLRIMEGVYRRGMLEEVMLEPGVVHAVFPCLDQLLGLHQAFLALMLARRTESLAPGSPTNFNIQQLGDLLLNQFSGQSAEDIRKVYSEFCSRHPKAVKLYKELLARDKRFQHFIRVITTATRYILVNTVLQLLHIRVLYNITVQYSTYSYLVRTITMVTKVTRGPLLRRHGIQECILLVTQRITKYPVLIQRILDNTKGNEEEVQSLSTALRLLKDLITAVDQEVLELERTQRLQEIQARLDPRAQTEVRGGGVFRGGELLRRRLVHDGNVLWKVQGSRMKDVQVLLMSDILVFLQDKDQKFTFPSLDKPSVVCLNKMIVRDIANQERGMFVISDSTPPEMYELYASSKEDRKHWMTLIQQTVLRCPSREEFPLIETEDKALLRRLRADIQQKDREVLELLQERVTLFSDLAELTRPGEKSPTSSNTRNLFRLDTPHAPQAEKRLIDAISDVDRLTELLVGSQSLTCSISNGNQDHQCLPSRDTAVNGSYEFNSHMSQDSNGNRFQDGGITMEEVCQHLISLNTQLHALQAAVICQDSVLELCLPGGPASTLSTTAALSAGAPRLSRSVSRDTGLDASGDAALLRRQLVLLQEEVTRLKPLEGRLAESEKARAQVEKQLKDQAPKGHRRNRGKNHSNKGEVGDVLKKASRRKSCSDIESLPLAPLASQETVDQLDGVHEGSEDEEPDVVRISPRSDSPRG
ncbi:Rho guanine nucleotide exchange factor 2 [Merluccius polli]|uniref:Rho guanine nucleotide exchange factor 2 n=1 Tax=Merluccius polli TaxID=89951 RepID=A0AA47PCI9_MERPO|nr:Rho guanine nucleotide exchange factor 2 [Merluccius polli]